MRYPLTHTALIATLLSSAVTCSAFSLSSSRFADGDFLPAVFTCYGDDQSPPVIWQDPPLGTVSYALLMDEYSVDNHITNHWIIYNIFGDVRALPLHLNHQVEYTMGKNDQGSDYSGPCPKDGKTHDYYLTLFALNDTIKLDKGAHRAKLITALQGHILGIATMSTRFQHD